MAVTSPLGNYILCIILEACWVIVLGLDWQWHELCT